MLLKPVSKIESVVQFEALEYIQAAAENDFPAVIGSDVAVMFGAAGIVGPGELNADSRTGIRDFLQSFRLAIPVEFVFDGNDMHSDFILGAMEFADGFHQFHQVAELVEHA